MQYPPVDFRLLRHLLTVASVEDEDGARQCMRDIAMQLNLYAPSSNRDNLAALVELAIQHPQTMRYAVQKALDDWTISQATETEQAAMHADIKRQLAGQAANDAKAKDAKDKHAEWQEEANRLWRLKYDRKKEDIAAEVAENCGGGTPKYIQSILRKPPEKLLR